MKGLTRDIIVNDIFSLICGLLVFECLSKFCIIVIFFVYSAHKCIGGEVD